MTWEDGPAKRTARARWLKQRPPRRRELDPPCRPVEQRSPQVGLEGPDGATEVRLGEMQPLRRAAEMQFLGDHAEHLELTEVHGSIISI
jgi:hypothetical protein